MLTYVLDASSVIRFLDGESGSSRVKQILDQADTDDCLAAMSAVNWGEVIYNMIKRHGLAKAMEVGARLKCHALHIEPASAERCLQAGILKVKYNISYADAFGLELASDSPDHILVTADYGVKPTEADIRIEFLPVKTKP